MRKLRFGVAGSGNWAIKHMKAIESSGKAELAGFSSHDTGRGMNISRRTGARLYEDFADMLSDDSIDVIDIATYNHLHADLGSEAIRSGKHVLVEKPIDTSVEKAERLVRLAERRGMKLSCISQFLFSPGVARVRSALERGSMGDLCLARASLQLSKNGSYYSGWRGRKEMSGGGIVIMNLIHFIGILDYLLGGMRLKGAYLKSIRKGIDVEDWATLFLEYPGKVPCSVTATNAAESAKPAYMEFTGTRGSLVLRGFSPPGIGSFVQRRRIPEACLLSQIDDMCDAVSRGREPIASGRMGLRNLESVMKIYEKAGFS